MQSLFYWTDVYECTFERTTIFIASKKDDRGCTAPQKLDIKNLTFGVFFNEINI